MSKRPGVSLILGVHNHQPLGNFEHVFQRAYADAYAPFLEILAEFPEIAFSIHNTGILYDWYAERHPEYLTRLGELVRRGQVEILTGGYYEPILPVIPETHRIGQIRMLSERVEELFGVTPETLWLTERVWEPHLPSSLAPAGVRAVLMDDTHFRLSGLEDEELLGYYMTEDVGHTVAAFPIDKQLRYTIPFREPEETIAYLRGLCSQTGERIVVMVDDGEKFGVWPGTHQWVYREGWLRRFFSQLREERDWLHTTSFREVLKQRRPLGTVYLPTASYAEMMSWALPAAASAKLEALRRDCPDPEAQRFLRGGFWRNFLVKYPESAAMHAKMLWLSQRAAGLPAARRRKALDRIWRGQCNCAYWHGLFGGTYLNHLRVETYRNLLEAERLLDKAEKLPAGRLEVERVALAASGHEVVRARTPELSLALDLSRGGCLYELSDKTRSFNLCNTMTRRPEAYHERLRSLSAGETQSGVASIHDIVKVKEEGLAERLLYDRYRRASWIEHFLPPETGLEDWVGLTYCELGDFAQGAYQLTSADAAGLRLTREGCVDTGGRSQPVRLTKTLRLCPEATALQFGYRIENLSDAPLDALFGSEWGFSLQAGNTPDRYYRIEGVELGDDNKLGSVGETREVRRFALLEEWINLCVGFQLDHPATLWRCPIETISNSEGGFERVYQSSVVAPFWHLNLEGGARWETRIVLTISTARL